MSDAASTDVTELQKQVESLTNENRSLMEEQLRCLKKSKAQQELLSLKQQEIDALKDIVEEQQKLIRATEEGTRAEKDSQTIEELRVEVSRLKHQLFQERSHSRTNLQILRRSMSSYQPKPVSENAENLKQEYPELNALDSSDKDSYSSEGSSENIKKFSEVLQAEISTKRSAIMNRRTSIANEIYMTEKSYCAILDEICDNYLIPLQEAADSGEPILSDNEIKNIFSCIEVLRNYNHFFLESLEPRVGSWEENQQLGDIFIELSIWIRSYSAFIKNYNLSVETYRDSMNNNEKFAEFMRNKMGRKQADLSFMLIAPVQRLPRYVLFLKDLVKCTCPEHTDYKDLAEALDTVKTIADELNNAKARSEDTEMVFEVAARFDRRYHNDIVGPARLFTRDMFMFTSSPEPADLTGISLRHIRTVILFSDLLVFAKPKSHPFRDMDSFSRPQLVSVRKQTNESKSITAFQQTEHDLEMISAISLAKIFIGSVDGDKEIKFIVKADEQYSISLYTATMKDRDEFIQCFLNNKTKLAGRKVEEVHIPPKSRRKLLSRRFHRLNPLV